MEKIFWKDPYAQELHTQVADVQDSEVLFEATIAFSFCGGQESDKAWVNGIPITHSRIENMNIWYTLPDGHGLTKGMNVVMTIDLQSPIHLTRSFQK